MSDQYAVRCGTDWVNEPCSVCRMARYAHDAVTTHVFTETKRITEREAYERAMRGDA